MGGEQAGTVLSTVKKVQLMKQGKKVASNVICIYFLGGIYFLYFLVTLFIKR